MSLKEMRAALAAARAKGITKLNSYNALVAKENPTADETAQIEALDKEIEASEAEVVKLQASIEAEEKKIRRRGLFTAAAPAAPGGAARSVVVSDLNPEATGGFHNLAEFAAAVHRASVNQGMDERLAAMIAAAPNNTMQTGGSAGEGYLVPTEFRTAIWELVFDGTDLLNRVSPEPTSSNTVSITKDETTPWGATGVQAGWRTDLQAMSASRMAHKPALVTLENLYAFVAADDNLLSDAPRLQSRLTTNAARAIRFKASEAIMTGDGVGKPLGFMKSAALVTVAKESSQSSAGIIAENVAKMYSRLLPGGMSRAFWQINSDAMPAIMTMTIGNQPIWTPPNAGFQGAPAGYLLGRPIDLSEHAETLGTPGDIALIDPAGYYAVTQQGGGIDFASSIHLYFDQGATAFRWRFRLGGQPFLSAAVDPAKGSNKKSHFVVLAARP